MELIYRKGKLHKITRWRRFTRWLQNKQYQLQHWWWAVTGACNFCGSYNQVQKRRMNTAYNDDKMNWETSCVACYEDHQDVWRERWAEYWSGCL